PLASLTGTPKIFSASDLVTTFGMLILSLAVAEPTRAPMMIEMAKATSVLLIKLSPWNLRRRMTGSQRHINLQLCVTRESRFVITNLTFSIQHQEPWRRR